ncbi:MAG: 7-cyano-7-deazaguanine synthase [Tannerellaceae bacterium]|jgi:7-cyano-7-deazaguanine synthase|nr:7-cyano-7-deazaguanine synthase [Tannerellaceae bacterium]
MGNFVVSFSGGLDSTALLLFLLARERERKQEGGTLRTISFDYGQKHRVELDCGERNVRRIAALTGVDIGRQVVDLRGAFSDSVSSLSIAGEAIPEGHYADGNMKSTVVENRNVIFSAVVYAKALSLSKRLGDDVTIALGIHQGDHTIYPDCRPESYELAKELFRISNWGSERVHYEAPFLHIDKGAILRSMITSLASMGLSSHFEEILADTNTCYSPSDTGVACGRCGACSERLQAFESLGLKDPVRYRKD